jgi:hypothetical protein
MKNTTLKSLLLKAKYLLVFLPKSTQRSNAKPHKTFHVHNLNFNFPISTTKFTPSTKKILKFKQSEYRSIPSSSQEKTSPISIINQIKEKQNLHNLHYVKVYFAQKGRNSNLTSGWKISSLVSIAKQFQSTKPLRIRPVATQIKRSITKVNKSSGFSDEDKKRADKENTLIEKECAHRRNYRNFSTLLN